MTTKSHKKYQRALDYIYTTLVELENSLAKERFATVTPKTINEARLLHRAIEACKHTKQPEFDDRFGEPK